MPKVTAAAGISPEVIDTAGADDLGRRAVRGGTVVFASVLVQKTLGFGLIAVLARLLTPEDYGLFGMVFAFTAFLAVFSDLGLTMATVQKPELTRAQLSTIFWVNLVFGVLLSGMAAAAAPAMAWFFGKPRLVWIAALSGLGFAMAGLGAQHIGLMTRRMQFARLAVCDVLALTAGGAAGVILALRGYGAFALVAQSLAQVGARSAAAWALSGWMPGLPARGSGVRESLRFGGYLTGFNALNYFARNMDKVLLGRFWGAAELGFYTRAYTLMMYPISLVSGPMGQVMIPAMSRLHDDPERRSRVFVKYFRAVAMLSFPLAVVLATMPGEAVLFAFGPRWGESAGILRVLGIAAFFQGIYSCVGSLYVATGNGRRLFQYGLASALVFSCAFAASTPYGAKGVAAAYSAAMIAILVPFLVYSFRVMGLPLMRPLRGVAWPFVSALVSAATMLGLRGGADRLPLRQAALVVLAGGSIYIVLLAAAYPRDLWRFVRRRIIGQRTLAEEPSQ